ncbi:MAG: permease [Candidatus Poribacteria bacterium]|nr:MAG: permease [Candidatus Poribacteria bacterium]
MSAQDPLESEEPRPKEENSPAEELRPPRSLREWVLTELSEESVLFVSVIKWFFLATAAGAVVGALTAFFLEVLAWGERLVAPYPRAFLLVPLGLTASALLVRYLAPDAKGHGTEKVIEAVHFHGSHIRLRVIPVKLLATVVTLVSGGSAGKEGPAAQIGAGACSAMADLLHLEGPDRRKLVICGISAGFATVFGTPIAGAIFGIEVLYCGRILYDVLLPAFVAGMTAYHVGTLLGVTYPLFPIPALPTGGGVHEPLLIQVGLAGIFFGLCAHLFIETLDVGESLSRRLRIGVVPKALFAGAALIGIGWLLSPDYLGLGVEVIQEAVAGEEIPDLAFFVKMVAVSLTLGFGGSGGVVTPMFFIGATAGNAFGQWLGLDPALFAAFGLVALLAGGANTPIAGSIMAVELFGTEVGTYAAGACVISFLMTGHRSVYPSQVLAFRKSASLAVPIGRALDHLPVGVRPREHTIVGTFVRVGREVQRQLSRQRRRRAGTPQPSGKPTRTRGAQRPRPAPRGSNPPQT